MYKVIIAICICLSLAFADKVWSLNQKGMKAFKNGEYAEALTFFDDALKESPHNRQLTYNRALVLLKLNRISEAKEAFDMVSFEKSDSLTSEVYYQRGLASQLLADSLLKELQENNQQKGLDGIDPSQLQGDPQMLQKLMQQQRIQQSGQPQEKQLTSDSVKSVYENALRNYTLALDKNRNHSGALKNRELSARRLVLVPDDEKKESPDQQNKDDQKKDDQNKDQQDQQDKDDQKKDDQNKDQQDQQNKDDQKKDDQNKDQQDQQDKDDQKKDDQNKDQQDQQDKDDQKKDDENKDQQDQQNKDDQKKDEEKEQPQPQPQQQDSLNREKEEALQMLLQFADDGDDLNKPQVDMGPAIPQNGKDW